MPNHITNEIKIIGIEEEVKFVREFMASKENPFDFNKVVKMPVELESTTSPMTIISEEEYEQQEKEFAELKAKIESGVELTKQEKIKADWGFGRKLTAELSAKYIAQFGAYNWYSFHLKNWGTKWNSYSHYCMENGNESEFGFQTAWSHPFPIMQKLSKNFPEIKFEIRYADEDFGRNIGEYTLKGGEVLNENFPESGSIEAYQLALDVQGGEDYYIYDVWEDIKEDEDIMNSNYYKFCLDLSIEKESFDVDTPLFVLETALQYTIDNEMYEKSKTIKELIDNHENNK